MNIQVTGVPSRENPDEPLIMATEYRLARNSEQR
jgi:hypothetical protein